MKTLQECNNEAARKIGYKDMDEMFSLLGNLFIKEVEHSQLFLVLSNGAEIYASQFREPSTEQSGGTEQEDDQELCWRDIYMSFNDGEGWLKFSSRMSKHFKITRKP